MQRVIRAWRNGPSLIEALPPSTRLWRGQLEVPRWTARLPRLSSLQVSSTFRRSRCDSNLRLECGYLCLDLENVVVQSLQLATLGGCQMHLIGSLK